MEKKRSVGVTILSLIYIVIGLGILTTTITEPRNTEPSIFYSHWGREIFEPMTPLEHLRFQAILAFCLSTPFLISGFGTLKLKKWGRILIVILNMFFVFLLPPTIITVVIYKHHDFLFLLIMEIFALIFSVYLARPKVKEQFK
ncbi:MAG: hypothetical protein WCI77_07710 [Candidatus Omnitrophota bacterium]